MCFTIIDLMKFKKSVLKELMVADFIHNWSFWNEVGRRGMKISVPSVMVLCSRCFAQLKIKLANLSQGWQGVATHQSKQWYIAQPLKQQHGSRFLIRPHSRFLSLFLLPILSITTPNGPCPSSVWRTFKRSYLYFICGCWSELEGHFLK